jgi:hypothetical protein
MMVGLLKRRRRAPLSPALFLTALNYGRHVQSATDIREIYIWKMPRKRTDFRDTVYLLGTIVALVAGAAPGATTSQQIIRELMQPWFRAGLSGFRQALVNFSSTESLNASRIIWIMISSK